MWVGSPLEKPDDLRLRFSTDIESKGELAEFLEHLVFDTCEVERDPSNPALKDSGSLYS